MKRKIFHTITGEEVVGLIPETPEDYAELERLRSEGKIDTDESLADAHARLAQKRKKGEAA